MPCRSIVTLPEEELVGILIWFAVGFVVSNTNWSATIWSEPGGLTLLKSATEEAVILMVAGLGTTVGAVYVAWVESVATTVPTVELPPGMPFTLQFITPRLFGSFPTAACKETGNPTATVLVAGGRMEPCTIETDTVTEEPMVMVPLAVTFVGSAFAVA